MSVEPFPPEVAATLARARDFLEGRAAEREALFVRVVLGEAAAAGFVAAAASLQDARGALGPLLAGDAPGPGVASTADVLGWLAALGVCDGAPVERAIGFLSGEQEADGGWRDPSAAGAEGALVAAVCALLARAPSARLSSLRRAALALGAHWSRERVQAGSYATIAGYLSALATLPVELDLADEALQWCGRELERGFRTGALGAVAVGRVFARCDALALPGARLQAGEVARALLAAQRSDGSFPGEGQPERVACEAAAALRQLAPAVG